jgi:hypothetical protein
MKQIIINIVVAGVTFFISMYYFHQEINKLKLENESLIVETFSLYKKINLIESSFDSFMSKGGYKIENRRKEVINPKKVKIKPDQELMAIKKDIVKLDKTLDSIKMTLPNRTGQDLINSLKLKTEI